jgi:hypothetical protein
MPTLTLKAYEYLAGLVAVALLCFGLWGAGDWHGQHLVQAKWDAAKVKQIGDDLNAVHASDIVTTRTVTQYITTSQIVLSQGATITKEIPSVITPKVDAAFPVPYGLVRVYNAGASGSPLGSNTTGPADDATAPVELSFFAGGVNYNLTVCRANAAQLASLQDWIKQQAETVNNKKGT